MSPYTAQRHAGSWRVVGDDGQPVSEHGAGAQGAAAATATAERLNQRSRTASIDGPPSELRRWRKAHGLSQAKLAKLLGVQWLAVQRWEAGTRTAPPYLPLALKQLERELERPPCGGFLGFGSGPCCAGDADHEPCTSDCACNAPAALTTPPLS